jgi:cysteine sulfinate desulfinase/cysteine desulfurase-like protein
MGRSDAEIRGSLRVSLGRTNDDAQADIFLDRLTQAVEQLQRVSGAGA